MHPVPPSQMGSMSDERKQRRIVFPVDVDREKAGEGRKGRNNG